LRVVKGIGDDFGMFAENGMNCAAEIADSLAMYDANLKNAALLTGGKIVHYKIFDLAWLKRVEIQDSVDWQLYWFVFVHRNSMVHSEKPNKFSCFQGFD
jgi:hypothetical protein